MRVAGEVEGLEGGMMMGGGFDIEWLDNASTLASSAHLGLVLLRDCIIKSNRAEVQSRINGLVMLDDRYLLKAGSVI